MKDKAALQRILEHYCYLTEQYSQRALFWRRQADAARARADEVREQLRLEDKAADVSPQNKKGAG